MSEGGSKDSSTAPPSTKSEAGNVFFSHRLILLSCSPSLLLCEYTHTPTAYLNIYIMHKHGRKRNWIQQCDDHRIRVLFLGVTSFLSGMGHHARVNHGFNLRTNAQ